MLIMIKILPMVNYLLIWISTFHKKHLNKLGLKTHPLQGILIKF